jgi:hypothetical protein
MRFYSHSLIHHYNVWVQSLLAHMLFVPKENVLQLYVQPLLDLSLQEQVESVLPTVVEHVPTVYLFPHHLESPLLLVVLVRVQELLLEEHILVLVD